MPLDQCWNFPALAWPRFLPEQEEPVPGRGQAKGPTGGGLIEARRGGGDGGGSLGSGEAAARSTGWESTNSTTTCSHGAPGHGPGWLEVDFWMDGVSLRMDGGSFWMDDWRFTVGWMEAHFWKAGWRLTVGWLEAHAHQEAYSPPGGSRGRSNCLINPPRQPSRRRMPRIPRGAGRDYACLKRLGA